MAMTERVTPQLSALSWLDRAIFAVSPTWGARRIATRRKLEAAEIQYSRFARIEAAETNEIRGDRWLISRLSPDSQLELDLVTARDRSREIYQNDAMGGTIEGKVNHVIGTGHTPQARIEKYEARFPVRMPSGENSTVVVLSDEAELYNKQLEAVYRDWEPRADRSGRRSLWMQSRLAERHNEFDGESFTVMSDVGRIDKPIPLALQVIDPERVNTPAEFAGDPLVRLGIRYTADGDIVGYYVQRSHPGDTKNFKLSYEFVEADRMLHVFEPWFAEQSRGLPWMTRALNRARDAKDVDEAAILGMQIEQCYAGFVESGEVPDPFASAATTAVSASGKPLQDIVPGTIRYLEKGQKVHFGSPTRPGNAFAPFQEWNYRRVAAAINWPYEMVVKNWGTLSFSAGRLVLTDAKKATQVGQKIMREMWLCRVWNRMVYESVVVGETDIDPRLYLQFPNVFERHVWIPPKWEYALNPGEEIDADIKEIDANLATLEDMLGKRGYDLEDLLARKKRERQLIKAAGLDEAPQAPKTPFGKPPAKKPVDADEADAESEEREVAA